MGITHIMRIRKNYSNPNVFFADIFNNESVLKIKTVNLYLFLLFLFTKYFKKSIIELWILSDFTPLCLR